jgi:hypothetical protein
MYHTTYYGNNLKLTEEWMNIASSRIHFKNFLKELSETHGCYK